ncbi:TPM domain-containing protein, partial [Acinetobacter schindleri]
MSEMLLKYGAGLILMLGMGMTTLVSAETATDTEEVIVAREILRPKNNQNTPAQNTETAAASQPQIANDMAEDQVQRDLPSLNEPVI